jgi:hypothetical protein
MSDTRFAPGYVWCYDHRDGREPNPMLGLTLKGPPKRAAEIYLMWERQRSPQKPHRCWTLTGPDAEPVLIELPPLWEER